MLGFFLRENDAWEDVITRRGREIPDLERMLEERMADLPTIPAGVRANLECLHGGMERQRAELSALQRALQEQQRFLARGREAAAGGDGIRSLSRQNLLRERIRSAERSFIELKCDFLNQLSAVY